MQDHFGGFFAEFYDILHAGLGDVEAYIPMRARWCSSAGRPDRRITLPQYYAFPSSTAALCRPDEHKMLTRTEKRREETMPTADMPKALQLPNTFAERLANALGQRVVVYLKCVHAPSIIGGPGYCPPYPPGMAPGEESAWGGPPLTPGVPPGGGHVGPIPVPLGRECEPERPEMPMMGTAFVVGTLGFVGADYLIIRVPDGTMCRDILIPYNAIGMVLFPTML